MKPYNLDSLESDLLSRGWTVDALTYVVPQEVPELVEAGGYTVTLMSPREYDVVGLAASDVCILAFSAVRTAYGTVARRTS